jgi:hypothetical protein
MATPLTLIASLIALSVLYLFVPAFVMTFLEHRGRRQHRCPQTGTGAEVRVAAGRAALTQFFGRPRLEIAACSLWPDQSGCGQGCLTAHATPAHA